MKIKPKQQDHEEILLALVNNRGGVLKVGDSWYQVTVAPYKPVRLPFNHINKYPCTPIMSPEEFVKPVEQQEE